MLLDWLGHIQIMEELAVVTEAPLLFGIAVLIVAILIFLSLEWLHREKVSTLEQRLAAKETEEWLTLFRERETLEEQVSQLKLGLPLFRMKSEVSRQILGMDEDDVREAQVKRKEQRIIELTNMMAAKQVGHNP